MADEPRVRDWVLPLLALSVIVPLLSLVMAYHPDPLRWTAEISATVLFLSCLMAAMLLACLAQALRWILHERERLYYQHQEAHAITPLLRAAQAVRQLTPEQVALVPRFMPDDAQAVYVEEESELVAHFYTPEGLVPWDFIERFLVESNNVYLMKVNSTNDKTPERAYTQAMTNTCIRKGWATPAVGPHPAMWKDGGREKAARYFHIKLRRNGIAEPEPEDESS